MSKTRSGVSRRQFMKATAGSTVAAVTSGMATSAAARTRIQGANDRVRIALVGSGGRGRSVAVRFLVHADAQYVAACDAYTIRLDQGVQELTKAQPGTTVDAYEDYRRVLERRDVDAIHIATPDHWHCQMVVDALSAGKDIYVEKPLSNTVAPAVAALKAYRASDRVVQFGTQQRSGSIFQDAARIVQSGQLGTITHAVCQFPGSGYGTGPEPVVPVPDGLNWDLFQGPAPRHPFQQGRLRWRGWWDYGGGLITDWGVHLTDIALWYLNAENVAPLMTAGTAQYVNLSNPERDKSPDAFSVSWQYPSFVMTFTNVSPSDSEFGRQGNYFHGPAGSLQIHRAGYEVRPNTGRRRGSGPAGRAQGAAAAGRATAPAPPAPAGPTRVVWREPEGSIGDSWTIAHARNFLDCVKSRQKPIADLEKGFYSSLPCLLAVVAIRQGRSVRWDNDAMVAVTV